MVGTNPPPIGVLTIAPFVEATFARAESVEDLAAFVPRAFYGSDRLWLLSVGARVNLGRRHHQMGRYGVAGDGHLSPAAHGGAAAGRDVECGSAGIARID